MEKLAEKVAKGFRTNELSKEEGNKALNKLIERFNEIEQLNLDEQLYPLKMIALHAQEKDSKKAFEAIRNLNIKNESKADMICGEINYGTLYAKKEGIKLLKEIAPNLPSYFERDVLNCFKKYSSF